MNDLVKRTHKVRDLLLTLGVNLLLKPRDLAAFLTLNMAAAFITCNAYCLLWVRHIALTALCLGTLVLICVAPVLGPAIHEGVDFNKYYRKRRKSHQRKTD